MEIAALVIVAVLVLVGRAKSKADREAEAKARADAELLALQQQNGTGARPDAVGNHKDDGLKTGLQIATTAAGVAIPLAIKIGTAAAASGGAAAAGGSAATGGAVGGATAGGAATAGGTSALALVGSALGGIAIFAAVIASVALSVNLISRASFAFRAAQARMRAGVNGVKDDLRGWLYLAEMDAMTKLLTAGNHPFGYGDRSGENGWDGLRWVPLAVPSVVNGGVAPGTPGGVPNADVLKLFAVVARVLAVEQVRGMSRGDESYFMQELGRTHEQVGTMGEALPFPLWNSVVEEYYAGHQTTEYGLSLAGESYQEHRAIFDALPAEFNPAKLLAQAHFAGRVDSIRHQLKNGRLTLLDGLAVGSSALDKVTAQANGGNDNGAVFAAAVNRTFGCGWRQVGWYLYDDQARLGINAANVLFAVVKQPGA